MNISVKYNDIELDKYMIVNDIRRGIGAPRANTLQKMGMAHGESFIGATRDALIYEMEFTLLYDVLDKRRELAGILNVDEPKILIFGDEPSLACLAIPDGTIDVEEKMFHGVGTITWVIPSGFSFALNTRKFTASMSADNILSMEVDNRGTVETPLSVRAEIKDDNGYFGIVGPNAAMEFGAIDEVDGYVDKMERAWYYKMLPSEASKFTVNNGVLNWVTSGGGLPNKQQGSFNWTGETAKVTDFGTVQTDNRWYGPSLSLSIPAKPADGLRTGNWRYHSWLNLKADKDPKKIGRQEFNISGGGKSIACFTIIDPYGSNYQTNLEFWVLGKKMRTVVAGGDFKEFYGCAEISKQDDEIIFKLSTETGKVYTCRFSDDAILTAKPDKWTYWVSTYKKYKTCFMSINSVVFDWLGTQKFVDVPNRYMADDVLEYDADTGKYFVNDILTMNDIVQGSLDIMIPPGKHTVEFYYSDFCEIPPVVTAEIRERWL